MAVILNHKTMKFRLTDRTGTVGRVDEVEFGHTPAGPVTRGYVYTADGRRLLEAQIPMGIGSTAVVVPKRYVVPKGGYV